MKIEMQCEECGEIAAVDESETVTVPDPSGGQTEQGKCANCGSATFMIAAIDDDEE